MTIKAADLAYVRVQVPNLEVSEEFFTKFGLTVRARTGDRLYFNGTDGRHHLLIAQRGERRTLALGFEVASADDLVRASHIAGATPISPTDEPGGGERVTLHDPDGNRVELVHGIARFVADALPAQHFNSASGRERRRNSIIRPPVGPSRVMRIGHAVWRTPRVARLSDWYRSVLGFLTSDIVPLPDEEDLLMSFIRVDKGEEAVDHHVFQALKGPPNTLHHISFEVQDIDDLHMGHRALQAAGYRHVWGIGRHLQGSQIFDYWLDPFGTMYEHWTDTDMFDASVPMSVRHIDDIESPWGPPVPDDFLQQGTA